MDKIAARTSATEAEAVAAKNIPAVKVKETATAIPSVEGISAVEQTTARRGQLLLTPRIAAQPSVMVEMGEMDAALKNLLVGKGKATVTAIPIVEATSGVEQTTAVLSLGMETIAALPSVTEETAAAPKNFPAEKTKATATVTQTARATSPVAMTTALKRQLSRMVTTAA